MMSESKKGVRNYRIVVTQGMSGYFAAMVADYEDIDWNMDVVTTGIGRYKTRAEAEREGKSWAEAEELPFVGFGLSE